MNVSKGHIYVTYDPQRVLVLVLVPCRQGEGTQGDKGRPDVPRRQGTQGEGGQDSRDVRTHPREKGDGQGHANGNRIPVGNVAGTKGREGQGRTKGDASEIAFPRILGRDTDAHELDRTRSRCETGKRRFPVTHDR